MTDGLALGHRSGDQSSTVFGSVAYALFNPVYNQLTSNVHHVPRAGDLPAAARLVRRVGSGFCGSTTRRPPWCFMATTARCCRSRRLSGIAGVTNH